MNAIDVAAAELVSECTAFLSGSLALERANNGVCPLDWEWLNLLAHGSEAQLRQLAGGPPPPADIPLYESQWLRAIKFLAEEVVSLVDSDCTTLEALQRSLLIPLELELAASRSHSRLPGPTVRAVLDRLHSASST